MNLTLLPERDPFLSLPTEPYDTAQDGMAVLATTLIETMMAHDAIGLAANQVGMPHRVFVMMFDANQPIACFNPEILNHIGEETAMPEGCLSFPGLELKVKRPPTIQVRYTDAMGATGTQTMTGLAARIFQHELDHLNGVTFDSRVGSFALKRAKDKRKKLR